MTKRKYSIRRKRNCGFCSAKNNPLSGRYLHYKGNGYEVLGVVRDPETLEELVLYKALYNSSDFGENSLCVRKKDDFLANVNNDGKIVPRFKYINN